MKTDTVWPKKLEILDVVSRTRIYSADELVRPATSFERTKAERLDFGASPDGPRQPISVSAAHPSRSNAASARSSRRAAEPTVAVEHEAATVSEAMAFLMSRGIDAQDVEVLRRETKGADGQIASPALVRAFVPRSTKAEIDDRTVQVDSLGDLTRISKLFMAGASLSPLEVILPAQDEDLREVVLSFVSAMALGGAAAIKAVSESVVRIDPPGERATRPRSGDGARLERFSAGSVRDLASLVNILRLGGPVDVEFDRPEQQSEHSFLAFGAGLAAGVGVQISFGEGCMQFR